MGTSSSNPGPTGRPPLLPPWAPAAGGDGGADSETGDGAPLGGNESGEGHASGELGEPSEHPADGSATNPPPALPQMLRPSWNSARRLIGTVSSGRVGGQRGRSNVYRAVRRSVGAMGGGRGAAQNSPAGRRTAGRFAAFLSGVAGSGVAAAARAIGLADLIGRSADVFLVHLADALAPSGALTEEAIARDAMDATLMELYDQLDIGTEGVVALEQMTPAVMADALVRYVINYIYARVISSLAAHIHATALTLGHIREVERAARRYIEEVVRQDLDTAAFFGKAGAAFASWDATTGQGIIDRLFQESYRVVEAGLEPRSRGAA